MGDYCSILLRPRLQSLNKYILFCPRLLSFESTRTNSAVWQIPHACAQRNHPGSGSHGQLLLPYWTLLELSSTSGIRTGESVSQRPFTSKSSANVSSTVSFEILVSPAQQTFPIELYIRRKLEREQQTKSRGKRATQAKKSLACSRLRDDGGKSFSNKKCEKRAGAGERHRHRPLSQVVRVLFSLCSF